MRVIRVMVGAIPTTAAALLLALTANASKPIVPALAIPVSHPVAPVAGKQFEVTFPVLNALTGERLTSVTAISFQPTIAGKPVQLQQTSFVAGYRAVAGVVWMTMAVPGTAEGKLLKVKVTITVAGRHATRTETYRVGKASV